MELNFPAQERKIINFWLDNKIFKASIRQRAKARDFVFYEGPPTANAEPGIHHVLSRIYKDIICRYKTMRGFQVLRKAGWDTHGLPVELEIEKKLGLKSKKDIEKYGIARFNKQCRESVWAYKKDWEKLTERIAFWLAMEHPYITYEKDYIETLWWIIKQIWQKGLLYQDYKVVPYCPRCGTSLSSHEVALGYKKIKEPAIYVKFKLKNVAGFPPKADPPLADKFQDTSLLVWTTTPWTLPGNVAIAVHPKLVYVAAQKGNEVFFLARERLSVLGTGCEVLGEFSGEDLQGIRYKPLFDMGPEKRGGYTVAGNFISAQEGTGLVHIAPAFGEEDLEAAKENNLPVLMTVDENGHFKPEVKQWAGMFVKDADPLIIEDLKKRGLLFKEELYEHDYPFCWRCSSPLLYYAKESWFIRVTKVRDKLIENNQKIDWIPSHIKNGRFGEWLKEVKDWAFSRERYWGTPLPIWQCEGCGQKEVIGSIADLLSKRSLHNKYFLMRHGHSLRQVKNIAMCWPERMHFGLTQKGRQEVLKTARSLKKYNIDLMFSSDLLRAKQTVKIVSNETGAKAIFDKRLREYNVGIFNGKNPRKAWEYLKQKREIIHTELPQGESIAELARRMYEFLQDVDKKYSNKNIVIVSHELPLTLLEWVLKGWPLEKIIEWRRSKKIDRLNTGEYKKTPFRYLPFNKRMELDLHRPYIDETIFPCPKCKKEMRRVLEVIDVWFDSGAMPFAQGHWPFAPAFARATADKQNQMKAPKLFPADYICEAVDQTRGWFYTLLAVSTLLGFGPSYRNVISLGHVLDEKGEKMSKSKGNVIDPWQVIEKYGADAVRWYFFTANQPGDAKLFVEKDIALSLKKFILTLWNSYLFWETYAKLNRKSSRWQSHRGFTTESGRIVERKARSVLDRWIMSRMNEVIREATDRLESYDVTGAARTIEGFVIDDLSLWYIRRSRRRFQHPENKKELNEAAGTLHFVLLQLTKLCAPFVPFLAEQIYKGVGGKKESVHLDEWPKVAKGDINQALEKNMVKVRGLVAQALAERAKAGMKVRQPLLKLEIPEKIDKALLELIKEEVNVKQVTFDGKFVLDTKITPELAEEGILREVIRRIQELRKKGNLKPQHQINIFYDGEERVMEIIHKNREMVLAETKARELVGKRPQRISGIFNEDVSINNYKVWLGIKKI